MTCLLDWERPSAGRIHFGSLARAFAAEGHEVIGVIPARRASADDSAPFARLYTVPRFNEGYAGQFLRAAGHLGVLSRAVLRERPDVIYVRFRSCAPLAGAVARMSGRSAVVIGEHSTWSSAYLKVSGYSALINTLSRWSQLLAARSAHRIRTSTPYLKEILVGHGIEAGRIFVTGMGADLDRFRPLSREEACARLGLDPSICYVGYAGSLNRWQGVDVVVDSLGILAASFPKVRLVIVGDGPQAENLRRQVARAGLSDRVVFKGPVPHEEIPWWIGGFDVGIGALRTQAGGRMLTTPMKLAEYAACGVPAITASVEGVEILAQRGAVLLVPPEDPSATAEAITRVLRDPELKQRMGLAARAVAGETLSWTAIARQILGHITTARAERERRPASDLRRLADAALPIGRACTFLCRRRGIYLPRAARSVWVLGERAGAFESAGPLIRRLREIQPKHRLVVMSADPSTFDWLCERYAGDTALPVPRDTRTAMKRFVSALAPRLVILLGNGAGPGRRWRQRLLDAGMPGDRLHVCDRLDFDAGIVLQPPSGAYLRRELGLAEKAPVILAEQVCPGEETILLDAFIRIRSQHPEAVLALEPRHRSQARRILRRARWRQLPAERRSRRARNEPVSDTCSRQGRRTSGPVRRGLRGGYGRKF